MNSTLSKTALDHKNIRWCDVTVEHPFDPLHKNFAPADPHSDWVQLVAGDCGFADESALLLCPYSDEAWLAWLPSKGEVVLHVDQLCRLPM